MEKSLVKYFSKDGICLKSLSLTGLHAIDLIENSVIGAAYLGIYKEPVLWSKINVEELEKVCKKGEKICKS